MDAIASSTGILWLFGILFGLPAALSVLEVLLWKYKNSQRLSLIFYVSAAALTAFLGINNFNNTLSDLPWSTNGVWLCLVERIMTVVPFIALICSAFLYRKQRKISIVLQYIASILAVIVWFCIIKTVNMK